MLKVEEIRKFMDEDNASENKRFAKIGRRYFNGDNDIKNYRIFYYNTDGKLVEDKTRSNIKIAHNFHRELCIQLSQYILSSEDGIIKSDIPELQAKMDSYFNNNEEFMAEFSETIIGCVSEGCSTMYAYKNAENTTEFQCAGYIGVIEVRAKDTDDGCEYVIYWYIDRTEKGCKKIKKIQVWDNENVHYYVQDGEGDIKNDETEPINPKPHTLYKKGNDKKTYFEGFGFIPFFLLENNKDRLSDLKLYKEQVDDYDIHASALTNNLVDFDTPVHVVKGFQGDNLDELQQNLKTKKIIGVDENGGVEVHTVEIPYQARLAKLEFNEKAIYRCGMGLNTSGLKDTNATTNMAIKAAYSLLDMKAKELEKRLKKFLRRLVKVVLDEINIQEETDYQLKDVRVEFKHEVMTNAHENAQIELTEAQKQQVRMGTLLNAAAHIDVETLQKEMCVIMDWDYEVLKNKLPDPNESENELKTVQSALNEIPVNEE